MKLLSKHILLACGIALACGLLSFGLFACSTESESSTGDDSPVPADGAPVDATPADGAPGQTDSNPAPGTSATITPLPESEWGNLFATMGEDYIAFGHRVQSEMPSRAYAMYQGEGGGDPVWFDEPDQIVRLFNALAATNVSEASGEMATDDYTSFGFEFADGSSVGIMFDSMTIMVDEGGQWKFYSVELNPDLKKFATIAYEATMGQ